MAKKPATPATENPIIGELHVIRDLLLEANDRAVAVLDELARARTQLEAVRALGARLKVLEDIARKTAHALGVTGYSGFPG
jgi:hypothetical protein